MSLPALFGAGLIGVGLGLLLSKRAPRPHVGWLVASAVLSIALGMAGARVPAEAFGDDLWVVVFPRIMGGVTTSAILATNACSTLLLVLGGRALWRAATHGLTQRRSLAQ